MGTNEPMDFISLQTLNGGPVLLNVHHIGGITLSRIDDAHQEYLVWVHGLSVTLGEASFRELWNHLANESMLDGQSQHRLAEWLPSIKEAQDAPLTQ